MRRINSAKKKYIHDQIMYVGYVRFYHNSRYLYQVSTNMNRLCREDALQDAKNL